jgi:hypothetical protein
VTVPVHILFDTIAIICPRFCVLLWVLPDNQETSFVFIKDLWHHDSVSERAQPLGAFVFRQRGQCVLFDYFDRTKALAACM